MSDSESIVDKEEENHRDQNFNTFTKEEPKLIMINFSPNKLPCLTPVPDHDPHFIKYLRALKIWSIVL